MNEFQLVGLIALLASLVLVGSGLRGRRLDWPKGLRLATIWTGIFVIVTLFILLVQGE